ncbi:MAG: hypothetical protein KGL39_20060 [Patescibacteria group bacterium]|nr:hypothetical protein [Patescibacteria group bacterium]
MDHESIIDRALAMLGNDMDDIEGKASMAHSMEDCPDPLNCAMHDDESGESLSGLDKPAVTIEVHKDTGPIGEMGDGLKEDEAEMLKKLLR